MPNISIIVPVYNVENYIHRCLDSILNQTFNDFELILVNDGSPDKSGLICDEYAKKDNRIKVIHKKNGGLADARNAGIDVATGEYIGFVDSDDYIEKDMFEKLLSACIDNDVLVSMCGRYDVYGEEIKPLFSFDGHQVWSSKRAIENLLTWNNIDSSACDKLFKKELFNNVRFPVGRYNEDIFIMTNILYEAKRIAHIGESKYYYCHRPNSITTELFSERKMDLLDASLKVLEFVSVNYPDLKLKAECFHYKGLIYLMSLLQTKKNKRKYFKSYNLLKTLLKENITSIMSNKHIGAKNKLITILFMTNTYVIGRYINSVMKRIA